MGRVKGHREALHGHDGVWLTHAEAVVALRHIVTEGAGTLNATRLEEGVVVEAVDLYEEPARYLEVFLVDAKHDRYYLTPTLRPGSVE